MNRKFNLGKLIYSNKLLAVFSVVLAIILWLVVVVELTPDVTVVVKNVPVQIDYTTVQKELGLEPYGESDFTVNVTVTGPRYIVDSSDMADKIEVTANTGYVNSVGTFSLSLDSVSTENRSGFTIDGLSSNEIEVYFDFPKTKEFAVEAKINYDGDLVPEGYYIDDYFLAESPVVKVTGPETEVNKITSIVASADVNGQITESITVDAALEIVTRDNSALKYTTFKKQNPVAHITVPVYAVVELPTSVSFIGRPSAYVDNLPVDVSIEPSSAVFGVQKDKAETTDVFEITSIDFNSLNVGTNVFTIDSDELTGGIVIDDIESFTVTVNVHEMSSIVVPADIDFVCENQPSGTTIESVTPEFEEITIVGPATKLERIDVSQLSFSVNLEDFESDKESVGKVEIGFDNPDCWLYGDYQVNVKLIQK